jgi:hypothetical protein
MQGISFLAWCVMFITGMVIYFPIIYIRKFNKMMKLLEQIEANTRNAGTERAAAQAAR